MHRELAHALVSEELQLDYQPKVELTTGAIIGVEALVRWQHPTRGRLSPDVFVPIAEQSELIGALTRWVMRTAVAQWRRWRNDGVEMSIAINFSARNLVEIDFPDILEALCRDSDV